MINFSENIVVGDGIMSKQLVFELNKTYADITVISSQDFAPACSNETTSINCLRGTKPNTSPLGDLIYYQGHVSPGIYARSYLEGRFDEKDLESFRREALKPGLSSYPHPKLMPDYWQFPTVSMGLGPLQAIYQAHFMRYMSARELVPRKDRKVWAFLGDGECDEPESLGAISLAGREKLENLIFVVNCNLQRLDGPVRGNGKIIQELESSFRGAGWNVIKVVWGRFWDPLLAKDRKGYLQKRMDETVDGEFQNYKAKGGQYTREHFFNKYPELKELIKDMSDKDIFNLNRGGHDPYKVFAAYQQAMNHKGQPTVILAHTVKGYGMGPEAEAQNPSHSVNCQTLNRVRCCWRIIGVRRLRLGFFIIRHGQKSSHRVGTPEPHTASNPSQ